MELKDQIKQIVVTVFNTVLPLSAADDGTFRVLLTAKVGDTEKPLLIVGNAHSRVEDGHVIGIYNPDFDLVDKVHPGCAYGPGHLKEIVAGKCDLMLDLWIDAYRKKNGVSELSKYQARVLSAAKFSVR